MEFKLCCVSAIALVLTISCNVYSIPLVDLLKSQNVSTSVIPLGGTDLEDESAENKTTNSTKDL